MDQAKPLIFSFDYPPLGGGISRLCHEIVLQSSAVAGVDFQIVTGTQRRPWREIAAFNQLKKSVKAPYYLCGVWYPEALIAILAGRKPLLILAHGSELMPTRQKWRRKIWAKLQDFVLSRADLVIANSHYTRDLVLKTSPSTKVIALPLAVNVNFFKPGSKEESRKVLNLKSKFIISTVARIHMYKGIDTVFHAIAKLPAEHRNNLLYIVAGSGPDRAALELLAEELNITTNVQWLGKVPEEHLPHLYRASDIFVLCTKENLHSREVEGFGLVFLEAQACGTPVIGARTGGIPDAVHENDGGWLIKQDDIDGLAEKIQRLIEHPDELQQEGKKALTRVIASCTWKHYVKDFLTEVKKLK